MKKLIAFFFIAFLAIGLFACEEREYPVDGEFLAYEVSVSRNAPQVVFVTVTIEKGKVVAYNIDTRQGTRTVGGTEEAPTYTFSFNAQTKKELGDAYGMKAASPIGKEWYEQAAAIEAFWLENGVDAMTVNADGDIDNVTGATITDNYSSVAKKALENAKAGKFVAILADGTNLYSAELVVNSKGEIVSLMLDTLQKKRGTAADVFEWNAQTKQQLGFAYHMHYAASGATNDTDYEAWLTANNKLEWFQQANLITDDIIANGWNTNAAENVPAGVTVSTEEYYEVLALVFGFAGDSVK